MASAILSLQSLAAPLQAFIDWLTPRPVRVPVQERAAGTPLRVAPGLRPVTGPGKDCAMIPKAGLKSGPITRALTRPTSRPLRVVRVFDGPRVTPHAGRMVISGRMADVCAELDRLAALEGH